MLASINDEIPEDTELGSLLLFNSLSFPSHRHTFIVHFQETSLIDLSFILVSMSSSNSCNNARKEQ